MQEQRPGKVLLVFPKQSCPATRRSEPRPPATVLCPTPTTWTRWAALLSFPANV